MDESRMKENDPLGKKRHGLAKLPEPVSHMHFIRSGRQDLNLRPLGPKPYQAAKQGLKVIIFTFAIIALSLTIMQDINRNEFYLNLSESKHDSKMIAKGEALEYA